MGVKVCQGACLEKIIQRMGGGYRVTWRLLNTEQVTASVNEDVTRESQRQLWPKTDTVLIYRIVTLLGFCCLFLLLLQK